MKIIKQSKKIYLLEFLIDDKKTKPETIDAIKKLIRESRLNLQVTRTKAGHYFLSIGGRLYFIDEGHAALMEFFKKKKLPVIRITDQAGDEIRRRAYKVLADIEQLLRTFIIRSTTENLGFDWWQTYVSEGVRSNIQKRMPKREKPSPIPIEYTTFEDLLSLITAEVPQWTGDKVITPEDLRELIADSSSLEEVLDKLDSKTKELSLWEDVFSLYFYDKKQWSEAKEILVFSIKQRNKVMHHRPIRLGTLKALRDKRRELKNLMSKAKHELEPQDVKIATHTLKVIQEWAQGGTNIMKQMQTIRNILSHSPLKEQMAQMQAIGAQIAQIQAAVRIPTAQMQAATKMQTIRNILSHYSHYPEEQAEE